MNQDTLERVLRCPTLPSLPAVAVRVLELTENPEVSLDELSATIENDQALAAKVLRTVNSSFFGLRRKCDTIHQALVVLGLSAVRTLVLGFSLVDVLSKSAKGGFDHAAYWRRGVYAAVGSRSLAGAVRPEIKEQAFLGGLLQDIGMMAMHQALKGRYLAVLRDAGGRHSDLSRCELAAFEVHHADVGAMLAQRWKLPESLVMPVKYHERPTAAPARCAEVCRIVALANLAHDALTDEDADGALTLLRERCFQWLGLEPERTDALLGEIARQAQELAPLLSLEVGPHGDAEKVLRAARERLGRLDPASGDGWRLDNLDADRAVDPLTGSLRREEFPPVAEREFVEARRAGTALSILLVRIDGLGALEHHWGADACDSALIETACLLRERFRGSAAALCRWDGQTFGIALRGVSRLDAVRQASAFRHDLDRISRGWSYLGSPGPLRVTASAGAASFEPGQPGFSRAGQLIVAASRALDVAAADGNCVRWFIPKVAA